MGAANTNTTAFLRTRADLNQPSDTQDWFNSKLPTNPAQVTAYAVVVEGAQQRLDIVYWWFFNYNQGKTVAGTSWGNHVSDWEHVRVKLAQVDFTKPQNELVVGVMYDHHGNQDNFKPGDGNTEFSGRQVLVHLANGDHEAYAKAGVYDRPMGTHDYCKDNAYRFDQRQGTVEIYLWNGSGFAPAPSGATPAFKDSGMARPIAAAGATPSAAICLVRSPCSNRDPREYSGPANIPRRFPWLKSDPALPVAMAGRPGRPSDAPAPSKSE